MSWLEVRVSEACREAADTVRPEAIRGLDLEPDRRSPRTQRAAAVRRRGRVLGPLAAAAAIAVVVAGVVVVPRLVSATPGHHGRPRHTPPPKPNPLTALPKFTVLNNTNALEVVTTATGHIAGRLPAPARQGFVNVVGAADDRTFFATADLNPQTACRTFFYRFTLSASGQPSALTPLPARMLQGLPTALAANAAGSLVAFSVVQCAGDISGPIVSDQRIGGIGLIDLATGKITRVWSYTLSEDYTSDLTMSADGRLLGYSNYRNGAVVGRVLPTSAPSGPDDRHSRLVVRGQGYTALSPNGAIMYALAGSGEQVLAAYDTTNGDLVKVLHRWPAKTSLSRAVADPAAGYLIVPFAKIPAHRKLYPFSRRSRHPCIPARVHKKLMCEQAFPPVTHFLSVNLATGAVTSLPFSDTGPPWWGMVAW